MERVTRTALQSGSVICGKSTLEPGKSARRTSAPAVPAAGSCSAWPLQSCTQPRLLGLKASFYICRCTPTLGSISKS